MTCHVHRCRGGALWIFGERCGGAAGVGDRFRARRRADGHRWCPSDTTAASGVRTERGQVDRTGDGLVPVGGEVDVVTGVVVTGGGTGVEDEGRRIRRAGGVGDGEDRFGVQAGDGGRAEVRLVGDPRMGGRAGPATPRAPAGPRSTTTRPGTPRTTPRPPTPRSPPRARAARPTRSPRSTGPPWRTRRPAPATPTPTTRTATSAPAPPARAPTPSPTTTRGTSPSCPPPAARATRRTCTASTGAC